MSKCAGCGEKLELIAQIRTYHSGCDPQGRVEMLERALAECAAPYVIGGRNGRLDYKALKQEFVRRLSVASAALEYRPAQMKGRDG